MLFLRLILNENAEKGKRTRNELKNKACEQQIHQFISVTKVYGISVVQNAVNLKAYVYMHVQKY